jgi:hypothetical protein
LPWRFNALSTKSKGQVRVGKDRPAPPELKALLGLKARKDRLDPLVRKARVSTRGSWRTSADW